MKMKKVLMISLGFLIVISVAASAICFNQYVELQRQKLYFITEAFMLMQNELDEAAEDHYKEWSPSGVLELLESDLSNESYDSMGDYQKIHDIICKVIQPGQLNEETIAYFEEVRKMRISTTTHTWKWAAYLRQNH